MSRKGWCLPAVLFGLLALLLCGCEAGPTGSQGERTDWESLSFDRPLELEYATQFSAASSQEGYTKLSIQDGEIYLLVPQGREVPQGTPSEITVIHQPLEHIYLAATSAMDLFRELGAIDRVTLSALKSDGWYIPEAREAMDTGEMTYAGKYNAPDYEQILSQGCDLAVESTMIYHNPEVKEQLEGFDIPVLVERSSYESHPLGRIEWIKLYGMLLGLEDQAEVYFSGQLEQIQGILQQENTGKTVAFFYITSNGAANIRKSGDYVAKAIDLAGGTYVFQNLTEEGSALSTMNMDLETFYAGAKDADVLIYNSAIDGELHTLDQLLEKSHLLADFKAVKEGKVWCTGKNLFQESLGLGDFIVDLHTVLTQERPPAESLTYLHPLQ